MYLKLIQIIFIELVELEELEEGIKHFYLFRGTAITLMTQFDVEKILAIENLINLKMEEIKFNEEKVLANMTEVTKAIKTIKIVYNFSQFLYRECNKMVLLKNS